MPKSKFILVAEDDAEDAYCLKRAFIKAGVDVHMDFVRDGQETIDYLKGENGFEDRSVFPFPDLLLLDLKMPRVDGFDVLLWLKKQPRLGRLLVTVLSSSDQERDVNRAYDLGANSYLVKPSVSEDLLRLVKRIQDYWIEINRCPDCAWQPS